MKLIGLLFVVFVNFAFADMSANCKNESGVISCSARESDVSIADIKCQQKDNQTICKGSYQDLAPVGLDMTCDHSKNGDVKCSGGTADGYKFSMSCIKHAKNSKNMDCSISDSLGTSLSLSCSNDVSGIPNCFGQDNDGANIAVDCSDDGNGNPSCNANIK